MFYYDFVAVLGQSRHMFWHVDFLSKTYDFKL